MGERGGYMQLKRKQRVEDDRVSTHALRCTPAVKCVRMPNAARQRQQRGIPRARCASRAL